jgi:hypothetical protein
VTSVLACQIVNLGRTVSYMYHTVERTCVNKNKCGSLGVAIRLTVSLPPSASSVGINTSRLRS